VEQALWPHGERYGVGRKGGVNLSGGWEGMHASLIDSLATASLSDNYSQTRHGGLRDITMQSESLPLLSPPPRWRKWLCNGMYR
jgi:hypothetical protein